MNRCESEKMLPPELLERRGAKIGVIRIDERLGQCGELIVARPKSGGLLAHGLGEFNLSRDEPVFASRGCDLEECVERRAIVGEGGVAPGGGVFEQDAFDLSDEVWRQAAKDGGGETCVERKRAGQVERGRHRRKHVSVQAVRVDQRIVLAPGHLTARQSGDLWRDKVWALRGARDGST
jgi:hypothetical protein